MPVNDLKLTIAKVDLTKTVEFQTYYIASYILPLYFPDLEMKAQTLPDFLKGTHPCDLQFTSPNGLHCTAIWPSIINFASLYIISSKELTDKALW